MDIGRTLGPSGDKKRLLQARLLAITLLLSQLEEESSEPDSPDQETGPEDRPAEDCSGSSSTDSPAARCQEDEDPWRSKQGTPTSSRKPPAPEYSVYISSPRRQKEYIGKKLATEEQVAVWRLQENLSGSDKDSGHLTGSEVSADSSNFGEEKDGTSAEWKVTTV